MSQPLLKFAEWQKDLQKKLNPMASAIKSSKDLQARLNPISDALTLHRDMQAKINPISDALTLHRDMQANINPISDALTLHRDMQANINPISNTLTWYRDIESNLDSITSAVTWQQDLYKNLNPIANAISNPKTMLNNILPQMEKQREFMTPHMEWLQNSPLFRYAEEMQAIVNKFTFIDLSYYDNIRELANEFTEEKEQAENNYYHRLIVEEYESEKIADKQQILELDQRVKHLESILSAAVNSFVPKTTNDKKANDNISLKACLTPRQIVRLHGELVDIFDATLEQWQTLFSDNVCLKTAICAKGYKSDVRVLFHYLKEYDLIETHKYPSILGKVNAFSFDNRILTAKQINATKENSNFPEMGNYIKIQLVIERL